MNSTARRLSAVGLALILGWEGFSALPYRDEAGVWTQGYGETRGVTASSPPVTREVAAAAVLRRADEFGKQIDRCIRAPLTQNQYDAILSATYNVGGSLVCGSTLQRLANAGDSAGMCSQLLRWNKLRDARTGQLRVSNGLDNRRKAEYALCVKG
jgi:lysozyme